MATAQTDPERSLMLDGNAAAGILNEIFALEMTTSQVECTHCGSEGEVATLLVFNQAPGLILRCPTCKNIILRVVQAPDALYLDLRGATYLCLKLDKQT